MFLTISLFALQTNKQTLKLPFQLDPMCRNTNGLYHGNFVAMCEKETVPPCTFPLHEMPHTVSVILWYFVCSNVAYISPTILLTYLRQNFCIRSDMEQCSTTSLFIFQTCYNLTYQKTIQNMHYILTRHFNFPCSTLLYK
jgi:hypothetical protein